MIVFDLLIFLNLSTLIEREDRCGAARLEKVGCGQFEK